MISIPLAADTKGVRFSSAQLQGPSAKGHRIPPIRRGLSSWRLTCQFPLCPLHAEFEIVQTTVPPTRSWPSPWHDTPHILGQLDAGPLNDDLCSYNFRGNSTKFYLERIISMATFAVILGIIAALLVVLSLVGGLVVMVKGPEANKLYANKFMQYRVMFQAIAVVLFVIAALILKNSGN